MVAVLGFSTVAQPSTNNQMQILVAFHHSEPFMKPTKHAENLNFELCSSTEYRVILAIANWTELLIY